MLLILKLGDKYILSHYTIVFTLYVSEIFCNKFSKYA
jgi:hypothetical protein